MTPFTKIVQEWRLKSWPGGVTSTVTITIKQSKEDTRLFIKQTGVPAKEVTRQEIIKFLHDIIIITLFRWILPKRAGTDTTSTL